MHIRCLDQTIPPCRSLCEDVQKSCEPHMRKHGFGWPVMMRCDQFPVDNNMCIQSQTVEASLPKTVNPFAVWPSSNVADGKNVGRNQLNQTGEKDEDKFYKRLLDLICNSDWGKLLLYFLYRRKLSFVFIFAVIKSGAKNKNARSSQMSIKKFKVIYGNLVVQSPLSIGMNVSTLAMAESSAPVRRKQKIVIVGVGNGKQNPLTARIVLNWNNKSAQIKKALKTAKKSDVCRRKRKSSRAGRRQNGNRKSSSS